MPPLALWLSDCARHSRSRSRIRRLRSPSCRSPVPAPPSMPAFSDRCARANARSTGVLHKQQCGADGPAERSPRPRPQNRQGAQARRRPAHDRRQRRLVFGPRRRRHHRVRDRARFVQARRADRRCVRCARISQPATARFREIAHCAEAVSRRQSAARRLCHVWQSGDGQWRPGLCGRPCRLRCASGLQRRRRQDARDVRLRREGISAAPARARNLRGVGRLCAIHSGNA